MSFIAAASQKSLLSMQKSFIQMSQMSLLNQININKQLMNNIETVNPDGYDSDPYYRYYALLDEQYGEQKDSLQEEYELINSQINALTTLIKSEMQSSTKLNYAGGS